MLRGGFRETPANHTMRLTWTFGSTVFVIRTRTVMSWVSESHVLGHSHTQCQVIRPSPIVYLYYTIKSSSLSRQFCIILHYSLPPRLLLLRICSLGDARKFSSSRNAWRISLWRSLVRWRAAASLFSFFRADGLAKYRFSLSVFSMPSLSMRFLNLDSTRSVGSPGLTLIVNIYPLLYLCCSYYLFR